MNEPIGSPLRGRPLALAVTSLFVLFLSLASPAPTDFEWPALGVGLISATIFWLQCFDFGEIPE